MTSFRVLDKVRHPILKGEVMTIRLIDLESGESMLMDVKYSTLEDVRRWVEQIVGDLVRVEQVKPDEVN